MRSFDPIPEDERAQRPERFSQTLLSIADRCPRSAHLQIAYEGGTDSHAMARGSVFHETAERIVLELVKAEESMMPGEVGKSILEDVLENHPELVVPAEEQDALRLMVWNFCEGIAVDPGAVLGVEELMTAELGGATISGRLDLVEQLDETTLRIRDWKTSLALPSQEEFAQSFQLPFYAVLAAHSPYGEGINTFFIEEVYPRYTRDDGQLSSRFDVVMRADLAVHEAYLERLIKRTELVFSEGVAPAVPGSQCSRCVAPSACPIPRELRPDAPESQQEAEELAEQWLLLGGDVDQARKQLRLWADVHGPIRIGGDLELAFARQESRRVKDWDKLDEAIELAAMEGVPFVRTEHVKVSESTVFKKRKRVRDEVEA